MNSKPRTLWHIATFQNAKSHNLGKLLLAFLICFTTFAANAGTNKAIVFDGTNDYIAIENGGAPLGVGNSMTISFWARRVNASDSLRVLNAKNSTSTVEHQIFMKHDHRVAYTVAGAEVSTVSNAGQFKANVWAHYVFEVSFVGANNASNVSKMWIDGQAFTSANTRGLANFSTLSRMSLGALIANYTTNSYNGFWAGQMADFRLWKKLLSADERRQVREGKDVASDLLCQLKFEDPTDLGKNSAANSTLTATASGSPATIKYIPNVYTATFSGGPRYFRLGDKSGATEKRLSDIDGQVSIAFWAKPSSNGEFYAFIAKTSLNNKLALSCHLPWTDGKVYFDASKDVDRLVSGGGQAPNNVWHFWTFVKNKSAGTMEIWRDAQRISNRASASSDVKQLTYFLLGSDINGYSQWKGDIDEFYLWNKAVDKAAMEKAMNGQTLEQDDQDHLLVYLPFNDSANLAKNEVSNSGVQVTNIKYQGLGVGYSIHNINNRTANIATPAYGVEVVKEGEELKWSVDFEDAVVSYNVEKHINGVWTKVTTVAAKGEPNSNYSVVVGEGEFRLTAVDGSGFSQSFATASTKAVFINLNKGWNLISVPFEGADLSALEAEGALWSWNGTAYEKAEKVNALQGLWVFSPVAKQVTLSGTQVADATVALSTGWNLVGPAENCTVPAGVQVFSWETTYQQILETSAGLIQGHGYWMFADKESEVLLSAY